MQKKFDLVSHIYRQRAFSKGAFGPGDRKQGVIDHIRKELIEVEKAPDGSFEQLFEWVDIILLALDGAWRSGRNPEEIVHALSVKQGRNEDRTWPDWRTAPKGKAIEHVK